MSDYNISPIKSMGGVVKEQTLNEILSSSGAPHYNWVEQLRLAPDFITPDNTLICVADHFLYDHVTNVTPLGLTQSFSENEGLPATLSAEIGSRRKRAIVGSSQGGSIGISRMQTNGRDALSILSKYGQTFDIDKNYWTEKEWGASMGLNADRLRTPMGLIVIEGDPAGRTYSCVMYEQCLCVGTAKAYQAGNHLIFANLNFIFEQKVPMWENEAALNAHVDSY